MAAPARGHPARLRGVAAGLLTAALSIAAHGVAGGGVPTGSTAAMLVLLAATTGVVAVTLTRAGEVGVLLGLLTAGQLAGHLVLAAAGHGHTPPAADGFGMLAAHAGAVAVGAALIAAADHLCQALSHSVRDVVRPRLPLPAARSTGVVHTADQPLRSMLLLATSLSQRGPPVSVSP